MTLQAAVTLYPLSQCVALSATRQTLEGLMTLMQRARGELRMGVRDRPENEEETGDERPPGRGQKIHVYPSAIATLMCMPMTRTMIAANGLWMTCQ